MPQPIRWGICATGRMAGKFVKDFVHSSGGEITAVCSRQQEQADSFAAEFNIPHAFGSLDDLLASGKTDIVYLCSPHSAHYAQAMQCLSAGQHVLCEKPMTLRAADTKRLYAHARERQRFIMEAMWVRFLPGIARLKALLEQGEIGEVRQLNVDFGFSADVGTAHRLLNPELGGGAMLDVGIYPMFLAYFLFGKPVDVASLHCLTGTGVDAQSNIIMGYANGIQAHLLSALNCQLPNKVLISGATGFIEIPALWMHCREIRVQGHNRNGVTIPTGYDGAGWHFQVTHVNECLANNLINSPVYKPADSIALAEMMDELLEKWGIRYPVSS